MYLDPIVGPCIDTIVDYATSDPSGYGCLQISCSDSDLAAFAEEALQRSGLEQQLPEIVRDYLQYGDAFIHIESEERRAIRLSRPYEIVINLDDSGQLKSGGAGSEPGEAAYERYSEGGQLFEQWGPLDIVHIARPPVRSGYGTSILRRLILDWQSYRAIERSRARQAAVPRRLRVHYVPVPWGASLREEQRIIKAYRQNNLRVMKRYDSSSQTITARAKVATEDVYIPMYYTRDGRSVSGKVDVVDLSEPLKRDEMEWWVNKVFSCLRVPPQLLYWDLEQTRFSRGTMAPWEEHWARLVHSIQSKIIGGVLDILLRLAALEDLLDKLQDSDLVISMPTMSWRSEVDDARAWMYRGQAMLMWSKAGFDKSWLAKRILRLRDSEAEQALVRGDANQVG